MKTIILTCFAIAAAALSFAGLASAEPDKPKPKDDMAVVAGQGQATVASNSAMSSQGNAQMIGVLHGADGKTTKTGKAAMHPGGSSKDQFAPYNKPADKPK